MKFKDSERDRSLIRSLSEMFEEIGTRYEIGGNTPFLLNDPESVWLIQSGTVEIFSVRVLEGQPSGSRYHFITSTTGDLLFGMDLEKYGQGLGLLAVGVVGTQVIQFPMAMFRQMAAAPELADEISPLIEKWVGGLSYAITKNVYPKPRVEVLIEPDSKVKLQDGKSARSKKGLVWLQYLEGSSLFIGMEEITPKGQDAIFPLTPDTWIQSIGETKAESWPTKFSLDRESLWSGLEYFYETLFKCEFFNTTLVAVDEYNRLKEKANRHKSAIGDSLGDLASILGKSPEIPLRGDLEDPLFAACLAIGHAQGIEFQQPPRAKGDQDRPKDVLTQILKASRVRSRRIILRDTWWSKDHGPFLAYIQESNQAVALIPVSSTSYALFDPVTKSKIPVTEEVAIKLNSTAFSFFKPFPDRFITGWELVKFGLAGARTELWRVLLLAMATSLLNLVVPIFTGYIFDIVIPQAEKNILLHITLVLFVLGIAGLVFRIAQSIALLRIEGKFDPAANAAVMDRLLNLPVSFFRNYSAGDLAMRAGGIAEIRKLLSGAVVMGILTGLFSLLSFPLLFYYDSTLGFVGLGIAIVAFLFVGSAGYFQMKHQRNLKNVEGNISGLVFQIITGIAKLRVAGAEGYAFTYWAKKFAEQKRLAFSARTVVNRMTVFNSILPIAATVSIFSVVVFGATEEAGAMSTGSFLAFNSAFTQFLSAAVTMSSSIILMMSLLPVYERLQPILNTSPEVDRSKASPGELSGEIEISQLSFRYETDGPLILKELSFHIKPGEFVAFVGPSGSGKSTLFRLLLGFEIPERGAIQFDGQDLSVLDIDKVRRQIGVVLQQSKIMPGNIFDNIIGTSLLTLDDAWEAARMAGLDQDIKEMPMGMHTIIGEGASTFSGGQRQRLLIARAIANKPRILLFDEATSALDNRTQAVVSESLERLQATRIVIAHRLSTIMNADRIFVMEDGRLVQSGKYNDLIQQPGLFAELAKRQLA